MSLLFSIYYIALCCIVDLKCLYSPWEDLTPYIVVCGLGMEVQVRTSAIVTHKTRVDTGVFDTVKDVIKAGTAVGDGLAIGAPFAELLPMFSW